MFFFRKQHRVFLIAIVTGECTILILQKYSFKVCLISFSFYSIRFKVYIYLLFINTQRQAKAPFEENPVISSINHLKTVFYQGLANHCEGCCNSDLIRLLQKYQAIHYCNQSVLAIFPDLNISVFIITIVDLISRSSLVRL